MAAVQGRGANKGAAWSLSPVLSAVLGVLVTSLVFLAAGWRSDWTTSVAQSGPGQVSSLAADGAAAQPAWRVKRLLRSWDVSPEHVWTALLKNCPNPANSIAVEVGVWNGEQCKQALKAGYGSVHCFEPGPINYNRTRDTLQDFLQDERLHLHQKVVANTTGDKVVFRSTGGTGDHAGPAIKGENNAFQDPKNEVLIESVALDDYFPDASATNPIFVMKIDTQGYDGVVLQGMKRLLERHAIQTLLVELWPVSMDRAVRCEETLLMMLEAGYELYELGMNTLGHEAPPSKESWAAHSAEPGELCAWYRENSGSFGIWSDIIAVPSELA